MDGRRGAAPADHCESSRRSSQSAPFGARGADPLTPEERIWQVVGAVPRGCVATYGQIARLAGMPRHARLVGRTLALLPAGSRLPWHRVLNAGLRISARGDTAGERDQRRRLENEGVTFVAGRVPRQHLWTS